MHCQTVSRKSFKPVTKTMLACAGGLALGLTLAFNSAMAGPPAGEDFNTGNAENWQPDDPLKDTFGPTTFGIDNGAYRMTTQPLPPIPQTVGAGSAFIPSAVDPESYSDGTVRAKVRFHNENTNAGIFVRTTGSGGVGTGYHIFLNNFQDFIGISDIAAGGGNIAGTNYPLEVGVDYMVEGRFVGSEISIKVWVYGEPEPAEPQVSIIDSMYPDGGYVALVVYNQPSNLGGTGGVLDVSFDDFSFTPVGTQLFDDFTGGGIFWDLDHNLGAVGGPMFEVIDSEYYVGSARSLPENNNLHYAAIVRAETYFNPEYVNGTVRIKFRIHSEETNITILMRDAGLGPTGRFYALYVNRANPQHDGSVGVSRWVNGVIEWEVVELFPITVGEAYYLEGSAIGDTFTAKVWAVSDEEPSEPQVVVTDDDFDPLDTGIALVTYNQLGTVPGQILGSYSYAWFTPAADCPWDFNGDGVVDGADLGQLLANWGTCADCDDCPWDLTGDCTVNGADLGQLLANWGECP